MINEVFCMDARKFLRMHVDVPLIIADPLYGAGDLTSKKYKRWKTYDGDQGIDARWMRQAYNALAGDGAMYLFCTWRNSHFWRKVASHVGFDEKAFVVWDKTRHGQGDVQNGFAPRHEFILVLVKTLLGDGKHLLRGGRPDDVWSFPKIRESELKHPYEKPIQLFEKIIRLSSDYGQVVVDPFCGSGNCAKAAEQAGRQFSLNDIDPIHANQARRLAGLPYQTILPGL